MSKKVILFSLSMLLIYSNILFSQTESPYNNFSAEILKKHKDYSKNFNAGDYNEDILYKCLTDIVDLARAQYSSVEKMKHHDALDSAALMQAVYMGRRDEKTDINNAPYRTTYQRLKKYLLTHNCVELLTKAKAYIGEKEYSYFDVSLDLVKSLLRNSKSAQILLNKQYTFIGFGFACDKYLKSIYASFIVGNDRSFNFDKLVRGDKNAPFTQSKNGLDFFDGKVCARYLFDNNLEALSDYISIKGNDVFLVCDDAKFLKRLIGREGDGIVLDFVQHSQYDCKNGNILDNDKVNRGFMTKMITYESILAHNTVVDKRLNAINAKIAELPDPLASYNDFDVNILIIKESKYVCRTIIKKAIECKGINYDEKLNFVPDFSSIKSIGDWIPVPENADLTFKIPFHDAKKVNYVYADFADFLGNLKEPAYKVNKIDVIVREAIHLLSDASQQAMQKKRGQSILKALNLLYKGIPVNVSYGDSWLDFQKDVVTTEYYYLAFDKKEAIATLKANSKAVKSLDSILINERYAEVILHVTYLTDNKHEQEYVVAKFNKELVANQPATAIAIQKYIIQQIEKKNYPSSIADKFRIPEGKTNQPFLNNLLYIQSLPIKTVDDKIAFLMAHVHELNPSNQITLYNKTICKVHIHQWNTLTDISVLQNEIDKLYNLPALPKERVNSLNLEMQFQILQYLNAKPRTSEYDNLRNTTIAKIKQICNNNGQLDSWQYAQYVANIFINERDYMYAINLMEPFLNDNTISKDFLFSYISIAAHREESYLSTPFVKAVKMAAEKDAARLCGLFDKLPVCVLDNRDIKTIICKTCNK